MKLDEVKLSESTPAAITVNPSTPKQSTSGKKGAAVD